ncbi:hypothetical protein XM38_014510 [Halomicronema hongdechloris C2206]|uniref:Uncharacterized protein n=1 Tax=Halomicronema hongdechloris C2206 TaxID=1641165 RepID=A0A1Z3HJM2_9CYAN|nr:hypothetical protein [Halomicronema hongdechloris]ASC70512.1 hypothetical protein XM38_014510 [Halomicronema hongdechloris C2206]
MTTEDQFNNYDRDLTPAEVAARQEREGEDFRETPDDAKPGADSTSGYTTDREGKLNNYPIEPEMYVNEPGDLRQQQEAEEAARVEELKEVNQPGGKGPGVI